MVLYDFLSCRVCCMVLVSVVSRRLRWLVYAAIVLSESVSIFMRFALSTALV